MIDFDDMDEALEQRLDDPDTEIPYGQFIEPYLADLQSGKITGKPPGKPPRAEGARVNVDLEARRRTANANLEALRNTGVKRLPPWKKFSQPELKERCTQVLKGDLFGLPVPKDLADFKQRGAKYLTQCFHAAGTLPRDNAVEKVVSFRRLPIEGKNSCGGAGPKAVFTVEYAKADPELHTHLFCKMPWAVEGESKEMGVDLFYRWKCSGTADYEAQETTIYRFLGPIFPFKIPKFYFGDICRDNTNYLLITEQIMFGAKGKKDFGPYEILPVAEKFFDFQLDHKMRFEIYYALMRNQARLAAWDKLGFFEVCPPEMRGLAMAPPPVGSFEFPRTMSEKQRQLIEKKSLKSSELLMEFVTDIARECFPEKHRDPAFLKAVCDCGQDGYVYGQDIVLYQSLFPDLCAFQHWNLQSDNAYYWRKDDGEMDCGLIDWGGAAPANFASKLTGSITSAEGEILDEHEDGFIRCFIDTYYEECGIKLPFEEFRRQWWLQYCVYIGAKGINVEMETFRCVPREEWKAKQISGLMDPIVLDTWVIRCETFMIAIMLSYLHIRWARRGGGQLHCHEALASWKSYWVGKGMT